MKESVDIIIAGVGGQGNVLASQIYAAAAVEAGLKVAVGETYGAAQRGGSVVSHLRISEDCKYGPLIPRGRAEAIVGLEPLEALRVLLEYGNCQTMVVTNDRLNYPLGVLTGGDEYPSLERLTEAMRRTARKVCVLPATEMAKEAGNAVAANVVLTGALAATAFPASLAISVAGRTHTFLAVRRIASVNRSRDGYSSPPVNTPSG